MSRTKTIGSVILFLGLIAIAVGVGAFIAQSREPQSEFETIVAKKGTLYESVEASGGVAYPQAREAAFMVSGYLATMNVELGQSVTKGQLLATARAANDQTLITDTASWQLNAPMAGVVTAIHVFPGEVVGAGMPIVVIEGPGEQFEAVLSVSENDIAQIQTGDRAEVSVEALGKNGLFAGRVLSIAPTASHAEGLVVYAVKVSLDYAIGDSKGTLSKLLPGMTADAVITTAEAKNTIIVPRRAVVKVNGIEYVKVAVDNEDGYEQREVVTGLRDQDGNVAIVDGLDVGEEVITKSND